MYTLNCYVNSLYTIFVPHTHTHTHTPHSCTHTQARTTCSDINWVLIFTLFSQSVHVHECTHLCTHIVMYTACTPCICHTYSTYTYSTLALLRKWNLVHNTYIHSCTVHLYARILMKNIKHVYTHSHTHMYIARKVYSKLVLCTCTCIIFHLTALCMYLISIPCPFAPCVWSPLMAGSLYIDTHITVLGDVK